MLQLPTKASPKPSPLPPRRTSRMPAPISMVRSAVFVLLLSMQLKAQGQGIKIVSPSDGATLDSPLTASLRWTYPAINPAFHPTAGVRIEISQHEDLSQPIISLDLPENQTSYRLAAAPQTTYYWRMTPLETTGPRPTTPSTPSSPPALRKSTRPTTTVSATKTHAAAHTGPKCVPSNSTKTNPSPLGSTAKQFSIRQCRPTIN